MKTHEVFVLFFAGLAFFSGTGILLARRLIMSAFSLAVLLLSVAGIYASLSMEAAFYTQLVLYIGGIMVLIGFALQLYSDPPGRPALRKIREAPGKSALLVFLAILCLAFAPWKAVSDWQAMQKPLPVPDLSLKAAGRHLLLDFPLEFEWLGILMLAAMLAAGWFLKDGASTDKK